MRIFVVDAFTDKPFSGNPAAVVPLEKEISEDLMQKIATENNLSETAYVQSTSGDWKTSTCFKLRWFTPTNEVPLCGHATLATSYVLFMELRNQSEFLEFETLSGTLIARRQEHEIILDFPSTPPVPLSADVTITKLIDAVVNDPSKPVQDVCYNSQLKKLLVRLADTCTREDLESIKPSFATLNEHDGSMIRGIIVTVKGKVNDQFDFMSRYFAPWNGIPEDPVTGSAHSVLGPYWGKELDKLFMTCRQCSKRGGDLKVSLKENRVDIIGRATLFMKGTLCIE